MTNDAVDFTALYAREDIHAGLVCLNVAPRLMNLDIQKSLFLLALGECKKAEPINEVIDITLDADGTIHIERYALPPSKP